MVLLSLAVFAGDSFAAHRITTWPDNRKGAVSLGFDDGCLSHLSLAVPALNARGFKGTFFLITHDGSDPIPDWNAWREVAAQGHEIGSHTMTHPWLTRIPLAQAQDEMTGSKAMIFSMTLFVTVFTVVPQTVTVQASFTFNGVIRTTSNLSLTTS